MTHGCQWLQEIPVTHVYSSRDRHVNEMNRTKRREDDGDQSIASFASAGVQHVPQRYERGPHHPTRLSLMNSSRGISEPPQKQTLTLRSSSKPLENPMTVYPRYTAHRAPFQNLKTWESTGSLASNSMPLYENVRTTRSFSHPRATQQSTGANHLIVPFRDAGHMPNVAERTIVPIHEKSENENENGRQMKLTRSHTDPFNHPFFHSNGTEHLLSYPNPMTSSSEIPRSAEAQDNFKLQNAQKPNTDRTLQMQRDNSVPYYTIHKPAATQLTYYGGVDKSQPIYDGAAIGHVDQRNVPFTKTTGKDSQEKFLRLMKPTTNHNSEKRELGRVVSLPPRHSTPKSADQLGRRQAPHQVIVDRPVDDSVTYTEISPQTLSRNARAPERKSTMIRSRSSSPVTYAEIAPPHMRGERVSNIHQHAPSQKQNNREFLTLGGDQPTSNGFSSFRHGSSKKPHRQNLPDKEDCQSQTPSEYSISFGTPRLELRRMVSKTDINNNQMIDKYHRRDSTDRTKPFPNSASLDQMLSDSSSSKKSGTIKSVLKQPSDKFPIARDVRGPNRSPKRVTIKEHDNRKAPPNGFIHATYRTPQSNGLTRAPVRNVNYHRPPDNKFKVINKRIVMAS